MNTNQLVALNQIKNHQLATLVSVASLVIIGLTLYSLNLQIRHTRMQIADKENAKKQL